MYSAYDTPTLLGMGFPIRNPTAQRILNSSPWLFAAGRVLHRPLMPEASTICPYFLDPFILIPTIIKEQIYLAINHTNN